MRGVNQVTLIGNLGSDPEVRTSAGGTTVANINVATSEAWTDRNSGEREERTEWHRCVMFGKLGEIAGQYMRKGMQVYVQGSLRTRKWQDRNGVERYTTEIVVKDMQMLGKTGPVAPVQHGEQARKVSGSDVNEDGGYDTSDMSIPF